MTNVFTFANNTNLGTKTWQSVACSADGQKVWASAFMGGLYYSSDAGLNFNSISSPDYTGGGLIRNIAMSSDGQKIVIGDDANTDVLYISTDGGTFNEITIPETAYPARGLSISSDGSLHAYVALSGNIQISGNMGLTYSPFQTTQSSNTSIQFVSGGHSWSVSGGPSAKISIDSSYYFWGHTTYDNSTDPGGMGTGIEVVLQDFWNPGDVAQAFYNAIVSYFSTASMISPDTISVPSSMVSFNQHNSSPTVSISPILSNLSLGVTCADGGVMYALTTEKIYKSTNSGSNFSIVHTFGSPISSGRIKCDDDGSTVFVVVDSSGLLSTNSGGSFAAVTFPSDVSTSLGSGGAASIEVSSTGSLLMIGTGESQLSKLYSASSSLPNTWSQELDTNAFSNGGSGGNFIALASTPLKAYVVAQGSYLRTGTAASSAPTTIDGNNNVVTTNTTWGNGSSLSITVPAFVQSGTLTLDVPSVAALTGAGTITVSSGASVAINGPTGLRTITVEQGTQLVISTEGV